MPPLAATSQAREQKLASLAHRQHGVVARRQLLALCFTRHQIQHLLGSDLLHSLYPGVYAVDGGAYHHTTAARLRYPQRDDDLQIAGYAVLRVTDRRLASDPAGVMRDVKRLLSR